MEKREIKISLKTAIILICVFLLIVFLIFLFLNKRHSKIQIQDNTKLDTISVKTYNNEDYYIIEKDYEGDFDLQFLDLIHYSNSLNELNNDFSVKKVMNYEEYKSYCKKWKIKTKYSDSTKNYIVFSYFSKGSPILKARFGGVEYKDNDANLYIWDYISGYTADISAYVLIVPTEKNVKSINIIPAITPEDFENVKKRNESSLNIFMGPLPTEDKPIIYLYPTEETNVTVTLGNPQNLTHTYPKYENSWNVLAKPNGDLIDLKTGRNLYALYWEGINTVESDMNEGFIVKGEEVVKFLEEKLEILGLNEREQEEFIVYWLPKLESNKYNFIRFQTMEEINKNMPLEIIPTPDTVIRIVMEFKGLENPIEVIEQQLETPLREGFTAVEWGGTEIK